MTNKKPKPKDDPRGLREIVLSIENTVKNHAPTTPVPKPEMTGKNGAGGHRDRLRPLTAQQREVLVLAFEEADTPVTVARLLEDCEELEPGCLPVRSGALSRSVTAFIAEHSGLAVTWSKRLSPFGSRKAQEEDEDMEEFDD